MIKANWIDRAIATVAPERAAKRLHARARMAALDQVRMMYDGAARGGRVGYRAIGGTSANTEILRSLQRLRDVCRDLDRNNAIAGNCRRGITANVVGAGIIPTVVDAGPRDKKRLQGLIKDHFDTPAIDFDGRNTLYGLEALLCDTLVRDGEVLLVRYTPPARLRLPVPMQVRVLEIDYLDVNRTGPQTGGGVCFEGVEFDAEGRRIAYWLYDEHPGGGVTWRYPTSRRVAASDVAHLYRVDRPGQMRGVPWGAPVIVTQWDLHDYEDAELVRQKIAACFAVFLTGDPPKNLADKVSTTETSLAGTPLETVEPGMIERLPNGTSVSFATPPMVQGYRDYIGVNQRKICSGYGVPYELGSGDLSQVTFISGRLGGLNFNRNVDQWRWHIVIPHGCGSVARWFLEAAAVLLGGPVKARLDWTPPRREMVSPKDEVPPIKEAIRAGLTSRSEELRKAGYDPEEIEAEQAEENARADKLGLRFDSDGRFPLNTRGSETLAPAGDNPPADNSGAQPPAKPNGAGAPHP